MSTPPTVNLMDLSLEIMTFLNEKHSDIEGGMKYLACTIAADNYREQEYAKVRGMDRPTKASGKDTLWMKKERDRLGGVMDKDGTTLEKGLYVRIMGQIDLLNTIMGEEE